MSNSLLKSAFFVQMDDKILRLSIPMGQKVLLSAVVGLSREEGYCYASDEALASLLYITANSVRNTISRLYISQHLKNIGTKSDRKLVFSGLQEFQSQNEIKKEFQSQNESVQSQNESHIYIILKHKLNIGQEYSSLGSKIGSKTFYELTFNHFWSLFPKRVKKQEAKELFKKLQSDEVDLLLCALPAIEAYHDSQSNENNFIPSCPHPTTFIRGKRWEDDVYTKQKKRVATLPNISIPSNLEDSLKRFRKLSEGDSVVLNAEDLALLKTVELNEEEMIDNINDFGFGKFRELLIKKSAA